MHRSYRSQGSAHQKSPPVAATGTMRDDGDGQARLRHRLGGVLAVLAGGGLLQEEEPHSLVARVPDQARDRPPRAPPLGTPPGSPPFPPHPSVAGPRPARVLSPRP